MDIVNRLFKISRDNNGVAMFIRKEEPTTGFVVVYNKAAFHLPSMTAAEVKAQMRLYLTENLLADDGVACWRKNQRQNIGVFRWMPDLAAATAFANQVNAQHVWDLAAKTSTQVNDFTLDLPGDGASEA